METKISPIWTAFFAGWLFSVGYHMGIQDAMGLEGYIKFMRKGWIELSPLVGALVVALACKSLWGAFTDFDRGTRKILTAAVEYGTERSFNDGCAHTVTRVNKLLKDQGINFAIAEDTGRKENRKNDKG